MVDIKKKNKATIIVMSGDFDKLFGAFILATSAAASNIEVVMFYTFWGLRALKKNVRTGKSISIDECEGNSRGYINAVCASNQIIHTSPDHQVKYKEYKRLYEHLPCLCVTGQQVAIDAIRSIK